MNRKEWNRALQSTFLFINVYMWKMVLKKTSKDLSWANRNILQTGFTSVVACLTWRSSLGGKWACFPTNRRWPSLGPDGRAPEAGPRGCWTQGWPVPKTLGPLGTGGAARPGYCGWAGAYADSSAQRRPLEGHWRSVYSQVWSITQFHSSRLNTISGF